MRRYRSALILLLVLALMAGGYYFYTAVWPTMGGGSGDGKEDDKPAAAATENIKLVDRKSDELKTLDIEYLSEKFAAEKYTVMEKSEGSDKEREVTRWRLTNRKDFRPDSSKLATAASNFCTITSSKIVEENAGDLSQYGFGGPNAARISGAFSDGAVVTLEIGDKNPTNDGYYVRKENERTIYLGSSYSSEKILLKKAELADLKLFALEENDVSRIEMTRGGAPLFAAWHKGEYDWELEYPVIAPMNAMPEGLIFESVKDLYASSYEEVGAKDLSKYGLDNPKYSLKFDLKDKGGSIKLLFGNEKSTRSTIYAMLGGTEDVFVISLDGFGYLDKPIKEFVDSFAYIVNINDVSHIKAEFDGNTVLCDIWSEAGQNDDDKFIVNGTDVTSLENEKSKSLFRAFYQGMIGVLIYDIDTEAEPQGTPEITFLYELEKEPFTMLVEFVPKDERLYYVFRNKEYAGLLVEKRVFDKPEEGLRATYRALAEGMEKAAQDAA